MNVRSIFFAALCALGISLGAQAGAQQHGLAGEVRAKAELAVAQFQQRAGGRLDYSEKSLVVLEKMLGEASQFTSQMAPKERNTLVELLGSYILVVAHRKHGGEFLWHDQRAQPRAGRRRAKIPRRAYGI